MSDRTHTILPPRAGDEGHALHELRGYQRRTSLIFAAFDLGFAVALVVFVLLFALRGVALLIDGTSIGAMWVACSAVYALIAFLHARRGLRGMRGSR